MAIIKLSETSTRAPEGFDKEETKAKTKEILDELGELQNLLYAQSKFSVLVILQGLDASGKDGTIRKVFGSLNPQGVSVKSFKVPTEEEKSYDFLWRVHKEVPGKGMIKVFNRSHYEDILVTRVHKWVDDSTAKKRMEAINHFENLIRIHNNTHLLKFYLHISREEQLERLNERIHDPAKQWKYNENDFTESGFWDDYMKAYEDCFEHCGQIPWMVIPADQNWYKEYLIASSLHKLLKSLDMQYPGLKKG